MASAQEIGSRRSQAVRIPASRGYDPSADSIYQLQQPKENVEQKSEDDSPRQMRRLEEWSRHVEQSFDLDNLVSSMCRDSALRGDDVRRTNEPNKNQKNLDQLLCVVSALGRLNLIDSLIAAGADPLCKSQQKQPSPLPTALHWAAAARQVSALIHLQSHLTKSLGAAAIPNILASDRRMTPFDILASDITVSRIREIYRNLQPVGQEDESDEETEIEPEASQIERLDVKFNNWQAQFLIFSSGQSSNATLGRGDQTGVCAWPKRVFANIGSANIINIACSQYVSACTTANGELYTWGLGSCHRLGHFNQPTTELYPRRLVTFPDSDSCPQKFLQVSLSTHHGAAITVDGALFTWGRGIEGQLGYTSPEFPTMKDGSIYVSPTNTDQPSELFSPVARVRSLKSEFIRFVACAEKHTVAVTQAGRIYTFGSGVNGQLGHVGCQDEFAPRLVASLLNTAVQSSLVAVGPRHTCVVTTSRDVYLFGFGNPAPRRVQFSFGYPSLSKSRFVIVSIASASTTPTRRNKASVDADEVVMVNDKGEVFSYVEGVDQFPCLLFSTSKCENDPQQIVRVYCTEQYCYGVSRIGCLFRWLSRFERSSGEQPVALERLDLIQRVEDIAASRFHVLYKVAGPLTPEGFKTSTSQSSTETLTLGMLRLLYSGKDADVAIVTTNTGKPAASKVPAAPRGATMAHSWVLCRIPILRDLIVPYMSSDGSIIQLVVPLENRTLVQIWLQWVYTDKIWPVRAAVPDLAEGVAQFRHELHMKPLVNFAQILKTVSLHQAVNPSANLQQNARHDAAPLSEYLRHQFSSPLDSANSGICGPVVSIMLTDDAGVVTSRALVHRAILSMSSEYFATMLDGSWAEADTQQLTLGSVSAPALHLLTAYMYSKQLFLDDDEKERLWNLQVAFELLALSDELLIPALAAEVEHHLVSLLRPENAARLFVAAVTYRAEGLQSSLLDYLVLNIDLLLRLNCLEELLESSDAVALIQTREQELGVDLPLKYFSSTECTTLTRTLAALQRKESQSVAEKAKVPKASPSSVGKTSVGMSSPPASPAFEPVSPIPSTPPSVAVTASPVAASPPSSASAPSPWGVVSKTQTKSLSGILKEEEDKLRQQRSPTRSPGGNPWAVSASPPTSSVPAFPPPSSSTQEFPKLGGGTKPSVPTSPTSPSQRPAQVPKAAPNKRAKTITIQWGSGILKRAAPNPSPAPWSPPPSPAAPKAAPKTAAVKPVAADADFPVLGQDVLPTSPNASGKRSFKEIQVEQQRQLELTKQKARSMKEILEEEALLAEHIRVEQYYESLKKQDAEKKAATPAAQPHSRPAKADSPAKAGKNNNRGQQKGQQQQQKAGRPSTGQAQSKAAYRPKPAQQSSAQ